MAKGTEAKKLVEAVLQQAFKADYLGKQNNKIYLEVDDGGEGRVQIAVTLTCPKTEVLINKNNWEEEFSIPEDYVIPPAELEQLQNLINKYNL